MVQGSRLLRLSLPLVAALSITASGLRAQEAAPADQSETAPESSPSHAAQKPKAKAPAKPAPQKPVAQAVMPALTAPAGSPPAAQLPNGASSITEEFGDWIARCRIENGQKFCTISQAQGNRQSGQRTFAVELLSPKDGKMDGTILMPFGLKLDSGATLKLDDKPVGQGVRFSTCIPDGCLLPVAFPAVVSDTMKTGKTLAVAATNLGTSEAVTFNISLNGFAPALARISDLAK